MTSDNNASSGAGGSSLQQGGSRSKTKSKNQQSTQQQQQSQSTTEQQRSYQTIPGISTADSAATTALSASATRSSTSTTTAFMAADASLRPNIGLTNRYADHALFGLALHTLLDYIRWTCIINATACILLAIFTWFWRLISLRLDKVILLAYLFVLSACLLSVEVWSLIPNVLPEWNATLQNQLGLLYHPPGKACFLLILATLCFGINSHGIWECIFGIVYCCCSFCLIHSWCLYPELRNAYADFNMNVDNDEELRRSRAGSTRFEPVFASWSDYAPATSSLWSNSSISSNSNRGSLGERTSLLYHQYYQQGNNNSSMQRNNEESI